MNKNTLPLPNPDFDEIKESLKDFMRNNSDLKDYDFDGSTLSIVLDTLAYNSRLNAFWLNMVGNEAFLKTAMRRSSVVSSAQNLGYTPQSAVCASTKLYLELKPNMGDVSNYITIPAGYTFTATSSASSYMFSTIDPTIVAYNNDEGKYIAEDVEIFEGRLMVHEFTVIPNGENNLGLPDIITENDIITKGISIPNQNVDANILRVYVLDENLDNAQFDKFDDTLGLDKDSKVFFAREDDLGRVNLSFGNGSLGYKVKMGAKIRVVYIISSGPGANGIATFTPGTELTDAKITKVIPHHPAGGGSFTEDINSIKYNAQLAYESQGKAVVTGDYEYLVRKIYPNARKVITWGGQDAVPPQFGKVFVSIQPKDNIVLTNNDKENIRKYISSKNVATIDTVILDPDYIFIDLDINLTYATNGRSNTGEIQARVIDNIKKYERDKLQTFDKNLNYSRLLAVIDDSSNDILSNLTEIKISKRLLINEKIKREYVLNFGNPIKPGSLKSSTFKYGPFDSCYFIDNGNRLSIARINSENVESLVASDVGIVDAEIGAIRLRPLNIIPHEGLYFDVYTNSDYIKISATPKRNNIEVSNSQIINIDNIKVNYTLTESIRK